MEKDADPVFVAITSGVAVIRASGQQISFEKGRTFLRQSHPLRQQCPIYFVPCGEFLESHTPKPRRGIVRMRAPKR